MWEGLLGVISQVEPSMCLAFDIFLEGPQKHAGAFCSPSPEPYSYLGASVSLICLAYLRGPRNMCSSSHVYNSCLEASVPSMWRRWIVVIHNLPYHDPLLRSEIRCNFFQYTISHIRIPFGKMINEEYTRNTQCPHSRERSCPISKTFLRVSKQFPQVLHIGCNSPNCECMPILPTLPT